MSIGPLVSEVSLSGKELWQDISRRVKDPQKVGLAATVSKEFQEKHGSLYLPGNKMVKNFDPERVWNVVWKITRGLYFHEKGKVLPKDFFPKSFYIQLEAGKEPPPEFSFVAHAPWRGRHPVVFDYKYVIEERLNNFNAWAFLLWGAMILMVCFHDPDCPCASCKRLEHFSLGCARDR